MKWSSFKYLVKQGWHSMVANRLMTLASIGVLVACLMITGVAVSSRPYLGPPWG